MINLPQLSQRDPQWKDKSLGTSDVTIGGYGCIVTCLAMISGHTDVSEVNQLMIDNGAFVKNNLTYWVKVPNALPNLKFVWRGWDYDNDRVRDSIYNKKFPVIVQVDAAPIGAPRSDHYVVYIGDQKLIDPWDGQIKSTEAYPDPKGYILYEVLSQDAEIRQILYGDYADDIKVNKLKQIIK